MGSTVIHFGATGLVGKAFLQIAQKEKQLQKIIVLTRRKIESWYKAPLIEQHVINFNFPDELDSIPASDLVVCTLGTTIKKAGSQDAFKKVDYDIPMIIAQDAFQKGAKYFILVSSIGASPSSKMFYLRIKGELERDLSKIPFKGIHILRPSLLLGKREEFRMGERIGQFAAELYSVFLPAKYKPVRANIVAGKIHSICRNPAEGIHIYEGKKLYY